VEMGEAHPGLRAYDRVPTAPAAGAGTIPLVALSSGAT
jgi:hypothetical protein